MCVKCFYLTDSLITWSLFRHFVCKEPQICWSDLHIVCPLLTYNDRTTEIARLNFTFKSILTKSMRIVEVVTYTFFNLTMTGDVKLEKPFALVTKI